MLSEATGIKLPVARVKKIIKEDPDIKVVKQTAVIAIAKSTELFLEFLVKQSLVNTKSDGRKIIQYKDLGIKITLFFLSL